MTPAQKAPATPRQRLLLAGFALLLLVSPRTDAQESSVILAPHVVNAVDSIAPGFLEVLDCQDSSALARLARTLQAQSIPEALTVLLWMLEHCPAWEDFSQESVNLRRYSLIANVMTSVPVGAFTATLRNTDERQRQQGVLLMIERLRRASASERPVLQSALIEALADPDEAVSSFAARPLRDLGTPAAAAALRGLASNPDISGNLYTQAFGGARPLRPAALGASTFSPSTLARLQEIVPNALDVLRTREPSAIYKLLAAIEQSKDPDLTPVLVWLFLHGDPQLGGWFTYRLPARAYAARLPIGELVDAFKADDPDLRLHIAILFFELFRGKHQFSAIDREHVVSALIERLQDRSVSVRAKAADALAAARSTAAVPALMAAVDASDRSPGEAVAIVEALNRIGNRDALPALERLAREGRLPRLREAAAIAYLDVAKPADPAAEIRRLLWEQPDTALEKQVLEEGHRALPRVWQALTAGSREERRAAAALLAWYPDVASIPHILAALDSAPGGLTRNQLLFDLSMILVSGGTTPDIESQRTLTTAHLHWLFDRLAQQRGSLPERFIEGKKREIFLYPDHVPAGFSVTLSAVTTPSFPAERPRRIAASATRLESRDQFLAATKDSEGLAFQAIHAAHGVARVATVFTRGGFGYRTWVTLYRHDGARWTPLDVPDYAGPQGRAPSNLIPSFNRNYGSQSPLRVVWLDHVMTHVRIDVAARNLLRQVSGDIPRNGGDLDASYAPLFERYKRSDSPSVRYSAQFEHARLTGKPDLPFWMAALEKEQDEQFLRLATGTIAGDALRQIDREGRVLEGAERETLVAAARTPKAVNASLLPSRLPKPEDVRQARQSGRFGLVEVVFGHVDGSGYSMLFERRGDRWVFLFIARQWIA